MNMVDFQEKMDPTHRMYLCQMLNVKNLSKDLLERYAQVKRMVDRIDGHLTPGDLAMIIISVGDNPEIATELVSKEGDYSPTLGESLDESDDKVIEEVVEQQEEEARALPVEQSKVAGEQDGGKIYTGSIPTAATATQKAVEQPIISGATGQAADKPKEGAKFWSPGMPVRVLHEDALMQGRIVGINSPKPGKAVQLTVEFDGGETGSFNEDEVEAI